MSDKLEMHEIYPISENWIPKVERPHIVLRKLRETAIAPTKGTNGAACFDISAAFEKGLLITSYSKYNVKDVTVYNGEYYPVYPGDRALIPTGWIFDIPYGYSMRIHPRSGLALKNGITLANAEAVIDEDYTQETFIMIQNNSKQNFIVTNGMRLAQAELVKTIDLTFSITDNPIEQKGDRVGGLGSTGV
jgi:dUTP pyrophosphatase